MQATNQVYKEEASYSLSEYIGNHDRTSNVRHRHGGGACSLPPLAFVRRTTAQIASSGTLVAVVGAAACVVSLTSAWVATEVLPRAASAQRVYHILMCYY